MAATQRTTRSTDGLSTAAYEKYRNAFFDEEDDEGEYEPRCCCCDSMSYVRYFGIFATLFSLVCLRFRLEEAIAEALILDSFSALLIDHVLMHSGALLLTTASMAFVAIAFKHKLGKLLYGPILMHALIVVINMVIGISTVWFHSVGDKLARKLFKHRLDDLAFDHPDRTYEELYMYISGWIAYESALGGIITFGQVPFHITCVVVCWRLRAHLEQQRYLQKAREERTAKKSEEKPKYNMTKTRVCHVASQKDCYLAAEFEEIDQMDEEAKKNDYKMEIIWRNVLLFTGLHAAAFYGSFLGFTSASWKSTVWVLAVTLYSGNCVTAGAHRLWTHKAYKANFWVRVFYMIGQTISMQHDVIDWSRDHRTHHKWTDSDADPHNSKRGFFFSHIGWLMVKKHPKVLEMGKKIDISDLTSDPVLAFQRKYYYFLCFLAFLFCTFVPVYFWNETLWNSYFLCFVFRLAFHLNFTWLINSAAHMFGTKAFDKEISATDSFFWAIWTNGEAWHNYHHAFPQDYRASEYMWSANISAAMIDFFCYMGWAWDRKRMSKDAIERQKTLKGDHSRALTAADDFLHDAVSEK